MPEADVDPVRTSSAEQFFACVALDLPLGRVDLVITTEGSTITGVRFGRPVDHPSWLANAHSHPGHEPHPPETDPHSPRAGLHQAAGDLLRSATVQLGEYAAGQRETFDLPLTLIGSAFQRAVWDRLTAIPYGHTTTYGALAAAIDRPGHARAVGSAVGANPLPVIVPCHRVLGAKGALTGFSGGLDNKIALLALEGVIAL